MVLRVKHVPSDLCSLLSLYLSPSSLLCSVTLFFSPQIQTSFCPLQSPWSKKAAAEFWTSREGRTNRDATPPPEILSGKAGTGRETCSTHFQVKPSEQVFRMQIAISLHMMSNKLDLTLFISTFLYALHSILNPRCWYRPLGKRERHERENKKLAIKMRTTKNT